MTIIDQIIASLRDEPESWKLSEERGGLVSEKAGFTLADDCSAYRVHGFYTPTEKPGFIARFRLRRAVRKWQRRMM